MQNSEPEINENRMVEFAERLAAYGIHYSKKENFEEQRIAIVLLDQSVEIMMKAFLISKGYEVFYLREKDIINGVKKSESFEKMFTIDFMSVLKVVKKELPEIDKDAIENFHKIRNKVYHGAAVNLQENKSDAMKDYLPKFEQLYKHAFPDRSYKTNVKNITIESG